MSFLPSVHALGGQTSARKQREAALARYQQNPNYCLACGSAIVVRDNEKVTSVRRRKFCGQSCAATYNNRLIQKRHKTTHCGGCGELIQAARKYCSDHCRKTIRQMRARQKPTAKRKTSHYVVSWRQRTKLRAIKYKGGRCQACGYDRSVRALVFHHIDGVHKDFSISSASRSWKSVQAELDKCVLLCSNCHAEVHEGLLNLEIILSRRNPLS